MEGRQLRGLLCLVLCGLTGCSWFEKRQPSPLFGSQPSTGSSAAPPSAPLPDSRNTKALPPEPTSLSAKPATCVSIGDLKSQLATDPSRTPGEREVFAQQAKANYQRALQLDNKFVPAYLGLALLCEDIGDRDEAMGYFRTALNLDSKQLPAYMGVARLQEAAGQRALAVGTLKTAANAVVDKAAVWYELGMCYARGRQFDDALTCLQQAAQLRPRNPDYAKAVGFMLARMGDSDQALAWLMKAMPTEAEARYNLARMLQHIGREEAGMQQLTLALKANPKYVPAHKMIAEATGLASGRTEPDTDAVRASVYRPTEPERGELTQTSSTLPTRPAQASPDVATEPPVPLIPAVSEVLEGRPTLARPITTAAPTSKKETPKPHPTISLGFEENP